MMSGTLTERIIGCGSSNSRNEKSDSEASFGTQKSHKKVQLCVTQQGQRKQTLELNLLHKSGWLPS